MTTIQKTIGKHQEHHRKTTAKSWENNKKTSESPKTIKNIGKQYKTHKQTI